MLTFSVLSHPTTHRYRYYIPIGNMVFKQDCLPNSYLLFKTKDERQSIIYNGKRFSQPKYGSFNNNKHNAELQRTALGTDRHESEHRGHPFRVSGIVPSTYHQNRKKTNHRYTVPSFFVFFPQKIVYKQQIQLFQDIFERQDQVQRLSTICDIQALWTGLFRL